MPDGRPILKLYTALRAVAITYDQGIRVKDPQKFLRLAETYTSLQGEGSHAGLPCFFIRTGGCDLRCRWCDTPAALTGGQWHSLENILDLIPSQIPLIQITGGEPMLQEEAVVELSRILTGPGYGKKILLETGGHKNLAKIKDFAHIVMDIKLPGSGEEAHDFAFNFPLLKKTDEIKFVIAHRKDFEKAVEWIRIFQLDRFQILFSPVWGEVKFDELAKWILAEELNVRMQIQMHKIIWGAATGGV